MERVCGGRVRRVLVLLAPALALAGLAAAWLGYGGRDPGRGERPSLASVAPADAGIARPAPAPRGTALAAGARSMPGATSAPPDGSAAAALAAPSGTTGDAGSTLVLHIVDEAGRVLPIEAARVRVIPERDGLPFFAGDDGDISFAPSGTAVIPLPEGLAGPARVTVTVAGDSFAGALFMGEMDEDPEEARDPALALVERIGARGDSAIVAGPGENGPLTVVLSVPGAITVRVLDALGRPREGARVTIQSEGRPLGGADAATDARGEVAFADGDVALGPFSLEVEDPPTGVRVERGGVHRGPPLVVTITLPVAPPAGTLVVEVSAPHLPGGLYAGPVDVYALDADGRRRPASVRPDDPAEGAAPPRRATFSLAPGPYDVGLLSPEHPGGADCGLTWGEIDAGRHEVRSGETTIARVALAAPGTLTVALEAPLEVESRIEARMERLRDLAPTFTIPKGMLEASFACEGPVHLTVRAEGRAPFEADLTLAAGEARRIVAILPPRATLAVRLVALGGGPAPEFVPVLLRAGGSEIQGMTGARMPEEGRAAGAGIEPRGDTADFADVVPGPYVVEAAGARATGRLAPGEAGSVELASPFGPDALERARKVPMSLLFDGFYVRWTTLRILVRDPWGAPAEGATVDIRLISGGDGRELQSLRAPRGTAEVHLAPGSYELAARTASLPPGPAVAVTVRAEDVAGLEGLPPTTLRLAAEEGASLEATARAPGWEDLALVVRAEDPASGEPLPGLAAVPGRDGRFSLGPLPAGVAVRVALRLLAREDFPWSLAPPALDRTPGSFLEARFAPGERRATDLALPTPAGLEVAAPGARVIHVRRGAREAFGPPEERGARDGPLSARVFPAPLTAAVAFEGDLDGLYRVVRDLAPAPGERIRIEEPPARGDAALRGILSLGEDPATRASAEVVLRGPGCALVLRDRRPFVGTRLPPGEWQLEVDGVARARWSIAPGEARDLGVVGGGE